MRLLMIGDAGGPLAEASRIARRNGADVTVAASVEEALGQLRQGQGADLVMMDVRQDVAWLISSLAAEHIYVDVVGCGVENDAVRAVNAIKAGAKEYVPLPPNEALIAAILETITQDHAKEVLCHSPQMAQVLRLADQVAPSEASILITGESGTGKEVMARRIHEKSRRAGKRMVSVNCAAIPEHLLESELFGHEKGAFTGAVARRVGKFEEADGSTILLDEISEMDMRLQAKLLRVLQEREIDRVGGSAPVKVDIRILATSNRNLPEEVKKGTFREDLYFRLNVITVALPPLRERREDILPFADNFIRKYAQANGLPAKTLSQAATDRLLAYGWPGNVRELENAIHRAVLVAPGAEITPPDVLLASQPAGNDNQAVPETAEAGLVGQTMAEVERQLILGTLDHCLGNRSQAANILGISIRTLRNKLHEYKATGS